MRRLCREIFIGSLITGALVAPATNAAAEQVPHATSVRPTAVLNPNIAAPRDPFADSMVKSELPLQVGQWSTRITHVYSDRAPNGLGSMPARTVTQQQCLATPRLLRMTITSLVDLNLSSCKQTGGLTGTKVDATYVCPGTTQYHFTGTISTHVYDVQTAISSQDPRAYYSRINASGRWFGKCR